MPSPDPDCPSRLIAGRYEVLAELGRAAWAWCYRGLIGVL
jgi:hypothetical protein